MEIKLASSVTLDQGLRMRRLALSACGAALLISFVTCFVILRAERLRIDHRSAGQHATRRRGHASLTTLMAPSLMRTRCVALLMHVGARQPAALFSAQA